MELGLYTVYGQIVYAEVHREVKGWGGTVWTDTETAIHVALDGEDRERVYYVPCNFPARPRQRIGVVCGKTSAVGVGRVKCLGVVNATAKRFWVFSRRWTFPLIIPLLFALFLMGMKAATSIELWDSGHYFAFLLAGLPVSFDPVSEAQRAYNLVVIGFLLAAVYPAYKMKVWQQIRTFVIHAMDGDRSVPNVSKQPQGESRPF